MIKRNNYLYAFFAYLLNLILTSYIFQSALRMPPFLVNILNNIGFIVLTALIIKFYYPYCSKKHNMGIHYVAKIFIVLHIAFLIGFFLDAAGRYFYISSYIICLVDAIFLISCDLPRFNTSRPQFLMTLRTALVLSIFIISVLMIMYLLNISFFNKDLMISYLMLMFCYIFSYVTS